MKRWLHDQEAELAQALSALAERIAAGVDMGPWPLKHSVPGGVGGAEVSVVVSAVRRIDARALPQVLREVGSNWRSELDRLKPLEPIPH